MRRKHCVEYVEDLANADILDAIDRADEIAPKVAQHDRASRSRWFAILSRSSSRPAV
jgi:hypothetical protein